MADKVKVQDPELTLQRMEESSKRYRQSEKGKATRLRYQYSDKGKATRQKHQQSPGYKAYQREYHRERNAVLRAYAQEKKKKEEATNDSVPSDDNVRDVDRSRRRSEGEKVAALTN